MNRKEVEEKNFYLSESRINRLWSKIRKFMEEQGITEQELSERLGISLPAVNQLLSGENTTILRLYTICDAIDCHLDVEISRTSESVEDFKK